MAVRVPARVRFSGKGVEAVALLATAFETAHPSVLLPERCAAQLLGSFRDKARVRKMLTAGGPTDFLVMPDPVSVELISEGRHSSKISCSVLISTGEREVLLSDSAIDALGVRIESFVPGHWRFADETRVRDTESPEYW